MAGFLDKFGNYIVICKDQFFDQNEFDKWHPIVVENAKNDKALAVSFRIYGSSCGVVEKFLSQGCKVRGWIRDANQDYLELTFQLDPTYEIPPYLTARIGVSCIVVSNKSVYVVQEVHGPSFFKFLTGTVDSNELPEEAVDREVFEEIGVKVLKKTFVATHVQKQALLGVDDYCYIYLVEIANESFKLQEREIKAIKNIPLDESTFETYAQSLTPYTVSMIRHVFFGQALPKPLLRAGKQVTCI